jgi:hypothetical protein
MVMVMVTGMATRMSNDATIILRIPKDRRRQLEREAKRAGRGFSEHLRKRLEPAPSKAPARRDIEADLAKARRDAGC